MEVKPIGVIRTPFNKIDNMPVQPKGGMEIEGKVHVDCQYAQGLKDVEGFSHLYLLYLWHKAQQSQLIVKPFMDPSLRGIFSTRSPSRPNPIGLSIVRLVKVDGSVLTIRGVDVLDGTPLIDIKPYIHAFDSVENSRSGWMRSSEDEVIQRRSDCRFQ
ncbi:MAG: tRNA (N6-threonylcarbamoyladenosine(37)-N6)-methyltransferase TrmO [Candidatus Omnitrophica bacterium]|nr:tRNA (N6-threonylcarbamoyladenosine(37)-N6)-methyltransferase TrmO [Candidatus Omnitrophota bacterium]